MNKLNGWGDRDFYIHFRQSLPPCLFDKLAGYDGSVDTLLDLMNLVFDYDISYHERLKESLPLPATLKKLLPVKFQPTI